MPVMPHSLFQLPEDEPAQLWKYMDFTRFTAMVAEQALFFSRADKLNDSFEGSWPRENVRRRAPYFEPLSNSATDHKELERLKCEYSKLVRQFTFINSWHANRYESLAMWEIYSHSEAGIAVRSTSQRLADALSKAEQAIHIGTVRYLDFERDTAPNWTPLAPFIHKQKSFEFEREVRAVFSLGIPEEADRDWLGTPAPAETGISVPVDLETLIEQVIVSPAAEDWMVALVGKVCERFGLEAEVRQSKLGSDPFF